MQTLLEHGMNPQICDRGGNTILHICDHREIIELFLKYGASPHVKNKNFKTPKESYLRRNCPPGSEIGGWADRTIVKLFEQYENTTTTKRAR